MLYFTFCTIKVNLLCKILLENLSSSVQYIWGKVERGGGPKVEQIFSRIFSYQSSIMKTKQKNELAMQKYTTEFAVILEYWKDISWLHLGQCGLEPKLFIFGSGSTF